MTWLGSGSRAGSHCSERTQGENLMVRRGHKNDNSVNGKGNQGCESQTAGRHWLICWCLCWGWLEVDEEGGWAALWDALPVWRRTAPVHMDLEGNWTDLQTDNSKQPLTQHYTDTFYISENQCWPDVSEHSKESTCRASNTSKSDFFTWIRLLMVPSWLVTTGCRSFKKVMI